MRLEIHLLGRFKVVVGDRAIPDTEWRRDRGAALIKLLAISPNHRLHREQIMEAFWPDLDGEAAGANLRKAVHFARRALGAHELIEVTGAVVSLAPDAELVIDIERFEAAAKSALRSRDRRQCEIAAELYGGPLLPDDRYLEWLEVPREQLQQRYAEVLRAGGLWRQLIDLDPADEEAQCAQMQAALDAGNRGEAIRVFTQLRERLRLDLGVGPSKAAVALYECALEAPGLEPVSLLDRVRASLARGLVFLQSGEFDRAAEIARETRNLALGAGLAREVGEASALLGLSAHMRGQWPDLFNGEFAEWMTGSSASASSVFEGHLCLAEFCLCGSSGHEEIGAAMRQLLALAEDAGSDAGKGLASLILGEAECYSGRLDEAERLLTDAEQLLTKAGAASGRLVALERLASLALLRGQKWRAGRLIQRGLGEARKAWLAPHLEIRLQALTIRAAATTESAAEAIREGDRLLANGACQICSMDMRTATAIALAEAGELQQLDRRLDEAERIAGMWHGGPWVAALWEARGVQRQAQGNAARAAAAFEEAAARYEALHRPLDQARCLARAKVPAVAINPLRAGEATNLQS